MPNARKTRAGALLFRHLPEEYRYRDNATTDEMGDLETYLHGFGHVLDLMQGTLAQAYADGFAEPVEDGRASQTWVLPYLASLLGTQLVSPDLNGTGDIRRAELGHAVGWSKGKGTLRVTDQLADVMADAETHVVEGWRRVAMTPRLGLPPFSLPTQAGRAQSDMAPLGTPDLRHPSRPVADETGSNPLQSYQLRGRDADGQPTRTRVGWDWTSRAGAPCFPGAFSDISVTTPDIRSNGLTPPGPAPRRVHVHVQPQDGFFETGLLEVTLSTAQIETYIDDNPTGTDAPVAIGPAQVYHILGRDPSTAPDRLTLTSGFRLEGNRRLALSNLNVMGRILVASGAILWCDQVAAIRLVVEASPDPDIPGLIAQNTLLGRLSGPAGFARLEYTTVMLDTQAARLQASDCIFVGPFDDPTCFDAGSCVRFSRLPGNVAPATCAFAGARSNTRARPRFVRRPFGAADSCTIRAAVFGEPGCGVLDHAAPLDIREGAEDAMEMGAFHAKGYAARLTALTRKLQDQLPLGQSLLMTHDPMLAQRPPTRAAE